MAGSKIAEEIAGRLIVLFGGRRLKEVIADKIVAHKKSVRSGEIAAHDTVAHVAAEPDKGLEAGTEVIGAV